MTSARPRAPHGAPGRLLKRADFLAVATGRRFHTERLTVQGLSREAPGLASLRVGFTVTKKVGGSPERNRIRRRLRSAVAEAYSAFDGAAHDLVVVGRRPALAAPYPILVDDLRRALRTLTRPKTSIPKPSTPQPSTPTTSTPPRSAAPDGPPGGGPRTRP